jgi:hypothetical protein
MYVAAVDEGTARQMAEAGICLHSKLVDAQRVADGFNSSSPEVRHRTVFEVEMQVKVIHIEAMQQLW